MSEKQNKVIGALGMQVGGDHYKKLAIQPMEYAYRNHLDPLQFSVVKYVTRFRDKAGKVDLEKAKHCIDMLIEFEYGDKSVSINSKINPMESKPEQKKNVVLIKRDGGICVGFYFDNWWWVVSTRVEDIYVQSYILKMSPADFVGWFEM